MYARVRLMAEHRPDALTVPRAAVVDVGGRRGVYLVDGETARFRDVQTGVSDESHIEVVDGVDEGARVVTMGALAIRDGERIVLAGAAREGGRGRAGGGGRRSTGAPGGAEPASATPPQP
jgi:multidrug efflux pump subunit AcrA (membrane-fusion protein)